MTAYFNELKSSVDVMIVFSSVNVESFVDAFGHWFVTIDFVDSITLITICCENDKTVLTHMIY